MAHVRKKAAYYAARGRSGRGARRPRRCARPSRSCGRASRAPCACPATASSTRRRPRASSWSGLAAAAPRVEIGVSRGGSSRPGRVRCAAGWREADLVVNAAGPEAPRLTPGLPIVPRKGHLVITDRYPGFLRHQVVELGYLKSAHTLTRESVAMNVQPRRTGQLLVGSSRELVGWDASLNRALLARMLRRAAEFIPAPAAASTRCAPGRASARRHPTSCRSSGCGRRACGSRPDTRAWASRRRRARRDCSPTSSSAERRPSIPRRSIRAGRCPPMTERVRFTVDGRPAAAEAGVSLLAALWNDGVRAVRTSVSGEARGPLCGMGTCFECRVTLDGQPHVRSCLTPVREGMNVALQAARVPAETTLTEPGPPGSTEEQLHAEVVVVGGGPAGLAAAVHAAEAGARTLLVDTHPRPGGQIWRHRGDPPAAARDWIARFGRAGATPLVGATVVDATAQELLLEHAGRPRRVRFDRLVLATGARELFLPFPGWTLPGVVGVGGAQAMLKAGARFAGKRVVVAGSGPLLLAVAAALAKDGARDRGRRRAGAARTARSRSARGSGARRASSPRASATARASLGAPYRAGAWVREVEPSGGALRATLTDGRRDLVLGLRRARLRLRPRAQPGAAAPPRLRDRCGSRGARTARSRRAFPGVFAAGELGGIAGVDHALVTGAIAGLAAAGQPIPASARPESRPGASPSARGSRRAFALRDELRGLAGAPTRRVPMRGRRPRPPRGPRVRARGQARDPRRHGPVPGPRLRSSARLPARLARRRSPTAAFPAPLGALAQAKDEGRESG